MRPGTQAACRSPRSTITERARDPGIRFLAAPKFLADIVFEDRDEWLRCHVGENGTDILTLEARKGELRPASRWYASMFTAEEDYLLRWSFIEDEQQRSVSKSSASARLRLGAHPVAEELRSMHLGRVLSSEYRPQFQAVLAPVAETFRA